MLLKHEIQKNFKYPYQALIDPELTIMKGAVLYGINPSQIISRKSPYTIGNVIYTERKEGTECRNMIYNKCEYFDVFFRKGDDIKNNEVIIHSFMPIDKNQDNISFALYYSYLKNQIYIDENVFIASNFTIPIEKNIPLDERIYELRIEFGPCLRVSGKNKISGKKIKIFSNY